MAAHRIVITADDKFISHLEMQARPDQGIFVLLVFERNSKFPVDQVANGFQPRDMRLQSTRESRATLNECPMFEHFLRYRRLPTGENEVIAFEYFAVEEAVTGNRYLIEKFQVEQDGSLILSFPVVQNSEYNRLWVERELRSRDEMIQNLMALVAIHRRMEVPAEQVELN